MNIYAKILKYTNKVKYDGGAWSLGWPWNECPASPFSSLARSRVASASCFNERSGGLWLLPKPGLQSSPFSHRASYARLQGLSVAQATGHFLSLLTPREEVERQCWSPSPRGSSHIPRRPSSQQAPRVEETVNVLLLLWFSVSIQHQWCQSTALWVTKNYSVVHHNQGELIVEVLRCF